MKLHSIILYISLFISVGCLGVGYLLAGYWLILPVLGIVIVLGRIGKNRSLFGPASASLVAVVLMAAIGILLGLSSNLMVIACTTALVSWEVFQFNMRKDRPKQQVGRALLEKYHLQSLALAASVSFMIALISAYINLDLPFVWIIALALTAIGGLTYSFQHIMRKKP